MSVPDPVSVSYSAAEEAAWYARLPTMFAAAAALFTSSNMVDRGYVVDRG